MSGFRWRTKHNVWHHTYTNIAGFDDDVETYGTLRLTPRAPWKPMYRLQAWYFPLVYGGIGFDFIVRDFMMVLVGKSDANHVYPKMSAADKVDVLGGQAVLHRDHVCAAAAGLPLVAGADWLPDRDGNGRRRHGAGLPARAHQRRCRIPGAGGRPARTSRTSGQCTRSRRPWTSRRATGCSSWYIGGLNYQIEHHLLPHVCHVNYPRLAPVVRATCEEFGVRYTCYPTWREALPATGANCGSWDNRHDPRLSPPRRREALPVGVSQVSRLERLGRHEQSVTMIAGRAAVPESLETVAQLKQKNDLGFDWSWWSIRCTQAVTDAGFGTDVVGTVRIWLEFATQVAHRHAATGGFLARSPDPIRRAAAACA